MVQRSPEDIPSPRTDKLLNRPEVQVAVFGVVVLIAVWTIVVLELLGSRREAVEDLRVDSQALARTLEAHTEATLEAATILLDRAVDMVVDEGMPTFADHERFGRALVRAADQVERVYGLGVFDPSGQLTASIARDSSRSFVVLDRQLDLSDRDYVAAAGDRAGTTIFVGRPVRSRADGEWVLPVSRSIRDSAGRLLGGAVALIRVEAFSTLFEDVRPAGHSRISLVRSDGVLLVEAPLCVDRLGRPLDQPSVVSRAERRAGRSGRDIPQDDGAENAGHMRTVASVARLDMRLVIDDDVDASLASWGAWRNALLVVAVSVSAILGLLTVILLAQWRRRLASEAALGQSRQALMESMDRFERSVAGATSALWEFDLARGGGYFAPQWEDMLGWRDVDDPYAHWRANLHPEDRGRVLADLRRHLDLHLPFDTEYRLRAADGSWRLVRARGQASWDADGRPLVMSGMVHDISDLRRSEERLRLALEATDAGLWDWNVVSGHLYMSGRWKTLLGYDARHPFAPHWRTFLRLCVPGERPRILEWVRDMLSGRTDRRIADFAMRRADGGWLWVRAEAKITERAVDGTATRVVGTLKDDSRRREAQDHLERAKEQAELASRAKSEFLANMSHELRTPLNAIAGFSESLENRFFGELNAKQLEYVRDIRASADHLTALISDILDMAKIESGRDDLRQEDVDVGGAILGKMQMIRQRADEKDVTLIEDLEPMPPYRLDARKFGQMILNLLSNAVKFTPNGGAVTVRTATHEGGCLEVSVIDTGIGIAAEDIPRVQEPFHQVDSRLSRQYEGTGLGLPLVKAMAELHGGRLDLQSVFGQGTTVTIWLPGNRRKVSDERWTRPGGAV